MEKLIRKYKLPSNMVELLNKYSLLQDVSRQVYNRIIKDSTKGLKKEEKPTAYIVIGQPGSGKSTFSANKAKSTGNILRIDGDEIRDYHPYINEIKQLYPEQYCFIVEPDAGKWKHDLFMHGVESGYNLLVETSTKNIDSFIDFMFCLKKNNFDIRIIGIAVNRLESMISIFERYCRQVEITGNGRIGTYPYHDLSYYNIMYVLLKVMQLQLCGIDIYTRNGECVYSCEQDKGDNRYINPYEAMAGERKKGLDQTLKSFPQRYKSIIRQLKSHNKTLEPMEQKLTRMLEQLYKEYITISESESEIEKINEQHNGF